MRARLRSWWQKIIKHPYATGIVVLSVLILILFIFLAYRFDWDWTGFNSGTSQITITSTSKVNYTATIPQSSKSLWDWLQLLAVLAIPVVVGIGAAWYTAQQGKVSDRENTDNQRETALQAYIDKISELLLKEHLGDRAEDGKLKSEYGQIRNIARVRTITVLNQLDARRVGHVFAFLGEAGLMSPKSEDNVVSLRDANLRAVKWSHADLSHANLSKANLSRADLFGANLSKANLSRADLFGANLSKANLNGAYLSGADLKIANLSDAFLSQADLNGANLSEANLSRAKLNDAKLSKASLVRTNLSKASLFDANLSEATLFRANLSGANLRGTLQPHF
jgi:Pentapeptide repeats (8 copies)